MLPVCDTQTDGRVAYTVVYVHSRCATNTMQWRSGHHLLMLSTTVGQNRYRLVSAWYSLLDHFWLTSLQQITGAPHPRTLHGGRQCKSPKFRHISTNFPKFDVVTNEWSLLTFNKLYFLHALETFSNFWKRGVGMVGHFDRNISTNERKSDESEGTLHRYSRNGYPHEATPAFAPQIFASSCPPWLAPKARNKGRVSGWPSWHTAAECASTARYYRNQAAYTRQQRGRSILNIVYAWRRVGNCWPAYVRWFDAEAWTAGWLCS